MLMHIMKFQIPYTTKQRKFNKRENKCLSFFKKNCSFSSFLVFDSIPSSSSSPGGLSQALWFIKDRWKQVRNWNFRVDLICTHTVYHTKVLRFHVFLAGIRESKWRKSTQPISGCSSKYHMVNIKEKFRTNLGPWKSIHWMKIQHTIADNDMKWKTFPG